MCRKATCDSCGNKSWWGCGKHVPSVMDPVTPSQRCTCTPQISRDGKDYPPMAKQADWLIRNAATAVLWSRGKKAGWSPEGVVEEPLEATGEDAKGKGKEGEGSKGVRE